MPECIEERDYTGEEDLLSYCICRATCCTVSGRKRDEAMLRVARVFEKRRGKEVLVYGGKGLIEEGGNCEWLTSRNTSSCFYPSGTPIDALCLRYSISCEQSRRRCLWTERENMSWSKLDGRSEMNGKSRWQSRGALAP